MVNELTEDDIISVVTYAGCARVLIDSASGADKEFIMREINSLRASGSTAGGEGIHAAYRLAEKNFRQDSINRVLLMTDGDFNVGVRTTQELERLMAEKSRTGIYLTILGVGSGGIRHDIMETIAKNGNGAYHYLNNLATAQKVLVDEMTANFFIIADDVKAQIEFNPALVESYRLIGYENRMLRAQDFADDSVDAGDIGVGTDVILMLEFTRIPIIELRYQPSTPAIPTDFPNELFQVNIRYKYPGEATGNLISVPVTTDLYRSFNTSDFNFALSVAAFGHILRNSEHAGNITLEHVLALASDSLGEDRGNHRRGFIDMVNRYAAIRR
jgi:Ca-activated chloride channel family protein